MECRFEKLYEALEVHSPVAATAITYPQDNDSCLTAFMGVGPCRKENFTCLSSFGVVRD